MKNIVFIFFILMTGVNAFAQLKSDSIEIKKGFGTNFRQHGEYLTPKKLLEATQSDPEAYKEMKIAKTNSVVETLLGYTAGALVGWPVGTAISSGEANWNLAIMGAVAFGVSIPFSIAYTKHAKNAVRIFNEGLKQTGYNYLDFKIGWTCNGIEVKMTL